MKKGKNEINKSKSSFLPFHLYLVKNLSKTPFFTPYFGGRLRGAQVNKRQMASMKIVSSSSSSFSMV
jgi:hypothetical protein